MEEGKAKIKAWVEELRAAPAARSKAHRAPCFATRASLRPNKISQENLEAFAPRFAVVPFHDESREWRPKITQTPFNRSTWHCINAACQDGIAVGADNMALSTGKRDEAVRFIPAVNAQRGGSLGWKNGTEDVLCATCQQQADKFNTPEPEVPVAEDAAAIFYGDKMAGKINEEYAYA